MRNGFNQTNKKRQYKIWSKDTLATVRLSGLLWAILQVILGHRDRVLGLKLMLCIYGTSHIILSEIFTSVKPQFPSI